MKPAECLRCLTTRMICLGIILGLLFLLSVDAQASHFRHGHLVWEKVSGVDTVTFTLVMSFRRDGYPGSGEDGFPIRGDTIADTIGNTILCFGDGICTDLLVFTITSFDKEENWIMGVAGVRPGDTTIEHVYLQRGQFVAFSERCCRVAEVSSPNAHINNPDGGYRLETVVLLE